MGRINNQITEFLNNWFGKIRLVKPKNEDHSEFNDRLKHFDNFVFLWKDSFSKTPVLSNKELTFSNYFGFGSHIDFVKRLIGKPAESFENSSFNVIILMYSINIGGHKVKFELHFHDKKLFCINYTYKSVPDFEKQSIIKALLEKYQISGGMDVDGKIIVDQQGNGLLFEDGENFSVNYLSPQSQVMKIAESWLQDRKQVV